MGGVFEKLHANLKVAREAWSKRPITLLLKVKKKNLVDNSRKKVQNYLRATHSDISNINHSYYQRV